MSSISLLKAKHLETQIKSTTTTTTTTTTTAAAAAAAAAATTTTTISLVAKDYSSYTPFLK